MNTKSEVDLAWKVISKTIIIGYKNLNMIVDKVVANKQFELDESKQPSSLSHSSTYGGGSTT